MSGREDGQMHLTSQDRSSMRAKVVLGVVVCLCVLAAAAVAAVVVTTSSSRNGNEAAHSVARSLETLPESNSIDTDLDYLQTGDEHRVRREARRHRRSTTNQRLQGSNPQSQNNNNILMSCITSPSNDSVPAAHIKGHGGKFHRSTSTSYLENPDAPFGYQQGWQCDEFEDNSRQNAHAYVDGGMTFNQTDKSLRVPECGYYHVFSQIYFQLEHLLNNSVSVYHLMKIERNCPSWPDQSAITVIAKSSVGPFDGHSGSGAVTTYTSDVIRLCKDGRIWVEISDSANGVPCCPMGDEHGTFMGAVLVSPTSCHWPPNMEMENLNDPDHQL